MVSPTKNVHYTDIQTKKGNHHGFPFLFFILRLFELHTFLRNGVGKKKRIRFLTDTKVVVFLSIDVVVFVVLSVVLVPVGCFIQCFLRNGVVTMASPRVTT